METRADYTQYLNDTMNYHTPQARQEHQSAYKEGFEKIYNEANEHDLNLNNAKSILDALSDEELRTIQHYQGLAEAIDKRALSNEAAYNLLMHDNEQYDFNNDGVVAVGAMKSSGIVPQHMPSNVRKAFVETMNSLSGEDRLMALTLTFDINRFLSQINGTPYQPATIDYDYLAEKVENILNPKAGAYSSESLKASITAFWEAFNDNYTTEKSPSNTVTSNEKEERDPAIEKFLRDLRTKGAVTFLAEMNQEKIDKLVEEFRQKLIDKMGGSPEALASIEELVSDFKKALLDKIQESLDSDDSQKLQVSTQAMIKTLLKMTESQPSMFERLLKEDQAI